MSKETLLYPLTLTLLVLVIMFSMFAVPFQIAQADGDLVSVQYWELKICRIRTSNLQFAVYPVYSDTRFETNPATLSSRREGNTMIVEGYTEQYRYTGILVDSWWFYVSWNQPFCAAVDGEESGWMPSAPSISIPVADFPPGGCYYVYLNDGNGRWLITDLDHPDGIVLQPDNNGWLELIGSPGQDETPDHYEPVRFDCGAG